MKRIIGLSAGLLIAISLAGCCHRQGYHDPCTGVNYGGGFGPSQHGLFSWMHRNNQYCCDDPCGHRGYPYDYGYGNSCCSRGYGAEPYYGESYPASSYDGDCCGGVPLQGGIPIEGTLPAEPIPANVPPTDSTNYRTIPTPTFNSSGSSTPLYIPGSYRRIPHRPRVPATLYW